MIKKHGLLFQISLSALLTGCMLGPDFHAPKAPKTDHYTIGSLPKKTISTPTDPNAGKSQIFVYNRDISAEWWQVYHSKPLENLVRKGIANSPNLASAIAALDQARETLNAQIGNLLLPALGANLSASRTRQSGLGFDSSSPSNLFNIYNANASVSYVLDVFGANRRLVESTLAQMEYAKYQLDAAYLSLTTNIVTTAITVASLEAQIVATKALIAESSDQLRIIKAQFRLGGASNQTVLSQQTLVAQNSALLPPLEKNLAFSKHALAALIGELPSESNLPRIPLESLTLAKQLPVSIPSQLVKQRPDIQASEALLHAATAQVGVATANLFPQITLTGSYGWTAPIPAQLLMSNTKVWALGADLAQPIFHGGALLAQRRAAIATYKQTEAQYHQVLLQAFQNVADALRAVEFDAKAFKAQRDAELSAESAYTLTKQQYRMGGASFLQLLNAEQQYQQTRILRIQAEAARYNDTAALFAALGGGWWHVHVECLQTPKATGKCV